MEAQETAEARKIRVEEVTLNDLEAVLKGWKGVRTRMVEDKHDHSEFEYDDQHGRSWKFTLDTRLGTPSSASLGCEGEIKAVLGNIGDVSLAEDNITFTSGKSSYKITNDGLRHRINFSDKPAAEATVDIPKHTS